MKIKCLKCGDIVDGGQKGRLVSCKCQAVAIDETKYYYRIIGEPTDYKEVKDE